MSAYQKALMDFLAQLGLPVHLTGLTPDASHFPYLTATVSSAAFSAQTLMTATAWFLGPDANQDRSALCDQLQQLVPECGVQLRYAGGMAILHRAGGDFITLLTDGADPRALAARFRLMIRHYDL